MRPRISGTITTIQVYDEVTFQEGLRWFASEIFAEHQYKDHAMKCFFVEPTGNDKIDKDADEDTFALKEYRRTDTGETLFGYPSEFGPGAMWFESNDYTWNREIQALYVVCPNGRAWNIDSRASNCSKREDNEHRCWIRHGTPPNITVDKEGLTCEAGGGSILFDDYHGFLRNGEFVSC
jgi:hypothetical protein